MALSKPCIVCERITRPGLTRCDTCNRQARRIWDAGAVANRRARLREGGGGSARLRRALNVRGSGTCATCGLDYSSSFLKVDHVRPLSLGGGDNPENLQVLCDPCHRTKSERDVRQRAAIARNDR